MVAMPLWSITAGALCVVGYSFSLLRDHQLARKKGVVVLDEIRIFA